MKIVDDTLKDNDGAWDVVRMVAGPSCVIATAIILVRMGLDDHLFDHVLQWATGLGATWGSYAGSVVAHAFAKK